MRALSEAEERTVLRGDRMDELSDEAAPLATETSLRLLEEECDPEDSADVYHYSSRYLHAVHRELQAHRTAIAKLQAS